MPRPQRPPLALWAPHQIQARQLQGLAYDLHDLRRAPSEVRLVGGLSQVANHGTGALEFALQLLIPAENGDLPDGGARQCVGAVCLLSKGLAFLIGQIVEPRTDSVELGSLVFVEARGALTEASNFGVEHALVTCSLSLSIPDHPGSRQGGGEAHVLVIAALVSLARSRASLTATQTLVWVLLILLVPLLGAIAWLVAGRPRTPVPSAP